MRQYLLLASLVTVVASQSGDPSTSIEIDSYLVPGINVRHRVDLRAEDGSVSSFVVALPPRWTDDTYTRLHLVLQPAPEADT